MAFTAEGNRKMQERLKAENGVDGDGKSIFHKRIGASGGRNSSYFRRLKEAGKAGQDELRGISLKGVAARAQAQNSRGNTGKQAAAENEAA